MIAWNWHFGDGSGSALQNPNHSYQTAGIYTVNLTVTDNGGAVNMVSHTVTVDIQSVPTTKVYYPNAVNITSGSYDWGSVASFLASDNDTYDVESASISGTHTIDLYMTTIITAKPENVTQLEVTHIGQYSRTGVAQNVYVYNFSYAAWQLVDTSVVGNDNDVTVIWVIDTNVADYISTQGQPRVRITGSKNTSVFYSWQNAVYWEVTQSTGGVTPPINTAPVAAFTSTCIDFNCDFVDSSTDNDGSITTWRWGFGDGDGTSSIFENPTHIYVTEGSYTVSLIVTDEKGSTNSQSHSVMINSQSTPLTKVYYPNTVSIASGSYDWGSIVSFTESDNDTYDVRSVSVSSSKLID